MPALADFGTSLLALLFPPLCVAWEARGAVLAPRWSAAQRGRPLHDLRAAGQGPYALDRVIAANVYEGAARKAILALKFEGQRRAAALLGELLAAEARVSGERPDVIVPVPPGASRLRARGANQAKLLARRRAQLLGARCRAHVLVRTSARAMTPQSGLSLAERRRNIAGAFAVADGSRGATLTGWCIAPIADVTTTGSTLDAAAVALRAVAPAAILGLAAARPERVGDDNALPPSERSAR